MKTLIATVNSAASTRPGYFLLLLVPSVVLAYSVGFLGGGYRVGLSVVCAAGAVVNYSHLVGLHAKINRLMERDRRS